MPELDRASEKKSPFKKMDCRVKPGNDEFVPVPKRSHPLAVLADVRSIRIALAPANKETVNSNWIRLINHGLTFGW